MSSNSSRTRHLEGSGLKATVGGVPYRLMGGYPKISQSDEGTRVSEQYLIKSSDAGKFSAESFPPPVVFENFGAIQQRRRMPGSGYFITKNVSFKPQSEELVWDPMLVYGDVSKNEAFDPYCLVDIEYETQKDSDSTKQDKDDPTTFLERSISAGGQWLSLPPQKVMLLPGDVRGRKCANETKVVTDEGQPHIEVAGQKIDPQEPIDFLGGSEANPNWLEVDPGWEGDDIINLDPDGKIITPLRVQPEANDDPSTSLVDNKDYELPVLLPIQTIEYTLKWDMVLQPRFGKYFKYIGMVNSDSHPLFWKALRETILFNGISASQKFVWSGGTVAAQPWTVDFRFSQRIVNDCGMTYGWNHVYVPDRGGWMRLYRANGQPLHHTFSIKQFFK